MAVQLLFLGTGGGRFATIYQTRSTGGFILRDACTLHVDPSPGALSNMSRAGVDPAAMRGALMGGLAYSRVLEVHGERMIRREYPPGFKARLHNKDMAIVLRAAADLGLPLPGTALSAQWISAAVGLGHGEEDSAVVAEVLRRLAPPGPMNGGNRSPLATAEQE